MFLIKYPVQEIVCRPEPASWLSTTKSFHPSVFYQNRREKRSLRNNVNASVESPPFKTTA